MAVFIWRETRTIGKTLQEKSIVWFTFSTFAGVLVGTICTLSSILAGGAGTLVDVHLTQTPRETCIYIEQNTDLNFFSDCCLNV